ncbi:MAG: hypothetical protein AABY16_00375, partial [Nanoarchaeota archaeon]
MKKKVTLAIDSKVYSEFKKHCKTNAIMLSKRIELFMLELLKSSKNLKIILFFSVTILLSFTASAATIFSDTFESGGLSGWILTANDGANNWTASSTDPFQGSVHAQSQPQDTLPVPASVMERIISTSGYQNISVTYYRKLVQLDAGGDEFQVEWFNGASWISIELNNTGANDASYFVSQFNLTSGADNNANFRIKFECTAGAVTEFCRVDNVLIEGNIIDTTAPIVSLNTPANNTFTSLVNVSFNASFTDNVELKNATLYLWNSTNSLINTTSRNITGTSNSTSILVTLPYEGRFYWNYFVVDSNSNRAFNHTNFTIFYDSTLPSISITHPVNNTNYSLIQTALNYTASDVNLQACWYSTNGGAVNTTIVCGTNVTGLNSGQGSSTWRVYANDSAGNINFKVVTFSVDSIVPTVNIAYPSNSSTLGNNVSISLNFTAMDINLQACWFNVNGTSNISLPNCANSTFNVSEGTNSLRVYANDSFGNIGNAISTFNVQVGAPAITLLGPGNGAYLNYSSVSFNFTATDPTLSSCGLSGNFNGTYSLNQTNYTMASGVNSYFNLGLADGNYLWAVSCNDTSGNRATTSNQTTNIDTVAPSVTLSGPTGTYASVSNIPITLNYSDASPVTCYYNVTFSATGVVVIGNTALLNCASSTFNVDIESSYIFA